MLENHVFIYFNITTAAAAKKKEYDKQMKKYENY